MPEPTTAWLWRPEEARERPGTLSLHAGALVFTADDGEVVRLDDVEHARRHRGTPVLEVRYRHRGESRVALLFFAKPPEQQEARTMSRLVDLIARGPRRVGEVERVRSANRRLKPLIEEWAKALRG